MTDKCYKIGIDREDTKDESSEALIYPNLYAMKEYPNYKKITVAPSNNHIRVMLDLLKECPPPYCILYVLLVPRTEHKAGRYQCERPLSFEELSNLLTEYSHYFENDGRHHIWVGSASGNELIVYDHHNVLYLYHMENQARIYLSNNRYSEKEIDFPTPHSHMFHSIYDQCENELLEGYQWKWFPLQEQDEC